MIWLTGGKISNFTDSDFYSTSTTTVTDDTWHHIAVTWDGTTKMIYVDGIPEASSTWSQTPQSIGKSFALATYAPPNTIRNFLGNMDEVKIYNYARSQTEIIEDAGIADIIISEVQINGSVASEDFVELYNRTDSAVDLSNWQIKKKSSTGTGTGESLVLIGSGKSIPAHGYFLWANNENGFSTTVGADVSNGNNIAVNNSIALFDESAQLIDQVAWGSGSTQFIEGVAFSDNPTNNQSLERKALGTSTAETMSSGGVDEFKGNGFDSGNNATDFILRPTSQPQNGTSPTEAP